MLLGGAFMSRLVHSISPPDLVSFEFEGAEVMCRSIELIFGCTVVGSFQHLVDFPIEEVEINPDDT
jgi:hypothetical protein